MNLDGLAVAQDLGIRKVLTEKEAKTLSAWMPALLANIFLKDLNIPEIARPAILRLFWLGGDGILHLFWRARHGGDGPSGR